MTSEKRTTGPLDRIIQFKGGGQMNITEKAFRQFLDVLSKAHLFDGMTIDDISDVCSKLAMYRYSENEVLLEQGKPTDTFFIIFSGEVKIYVAKGLFRQSTEVARVHCGGILGEMAMVTGEDCTATVVATGDVKVFAGDKSLFDDLLSVNKSFAKNMKRVLHERDNADAALQVEEHLDEDESYEIVDEPDEYETRTIFSPRQYRMLSMEKEEKAQFLIMLKDHYLFDRLSRVWLDHLVATAEHVEYPTGELLVRQGYLGSAIYVFSEGRVSIRASACRSVEKSAEVARLGAGDVCGEMSVILSEPATASVVALQRVTAFIIVRDVFEELVESNEDFASAVYALAVERKSVQIKKKSGR